VDKPMFPKPGQIKKQPEAVKVLKDGREICNMNTTAGRKEYFRRIRVMWERQDKVCCLYGKVEGCPGRLSIVDATFEHQDGRGHGGGHHDDRIEKPDPVTGEIKPYNGAAHNLCNMRKGSVRMDYNSDILEAI